MTIKLVRHGQSAANAHGYDNASQADCHIALTDLGQQQAEEAGRIIGSNFLADALIYCSPYARTRATLDGIITGSGIPSWIITTYEDPRLREVEHGYHDMDEQMSMREIHGSFFYRMRGGESPADCFDRICTFLESLKRQSERKDKDDVLIVSHGMAIRCFVMRYLHLKVEQFEQMRNPWNGSVVTIDEWKNLENPIFTQGKWGVEGLKLK